MPRLRRAQRFFLPLARHRHRDVLRDIGENLSVPFAVAYRRIVALQRDHSEYLAALAQRSSQPVNAIRTQRLDLAGLLEGANFPEVGQECLAGAQYVLGEPPAALASGRHRITLIDEVGEVEVFTAGVEQRDVQIFGVHQFADDLVKNDEQLPNVIHRIGAIADAIKGGLQLFRMFTFGDVEGCAQHRLLAGELGHDGGEVEPTIVPLAVDDAQLVALNRNITSLLGGGAQLHHLALIGMDQIPGAHHLKLGGAIARNLLRGLIGIKEAPAVVDQNGGSGALSQRAEFAFALGQSLLGPLTLGDIYQSALDHGGIFIFEQSHVLEHPDLAAVPTA